MDEVQPALLTVLLTGWDSGTQGGAQDVFFSPDIDFRQVFKWDQDGGFGGHRTGGRVGTSEREATKDLCIVICKFRIFTLFLIVLFKSPVF